MTPDNAPSRTDEYISDNPAQDQAAETPGGMDSLGSYEDGGADDDFNAAAGDDAAGDGDGDGTVESGSGTVDDGR